MEDRPFYFSPIRNIENKNFDKSMENFYKQDIDATIKEDLQNALDARLKTNTNPVHVNITIDEMQTKDIPGIHQLEEHIFSLHGGNEYSNQTIRNIQKKIKEPKNHVLIIEDENTKGLSGANLSSEDDNNTYYAYAYKKGVHPKLEDDDFEASRGGSHGIGKIANNAASDALLMFFSNCDEWQNQHIGGTIHLIEHQIKDQVYRETGYFTAYNDKSNEYIPHENEGMPAIFSKTTRGLKIVIPFFRKDFNDSKKIIKAILDNYFLAIIKENLEVTLNNKLEELQIQITKDTISSLLNDSSYYTQEVSQMKEKELNPLYVQTYTENEPIDLVIPTKQNEFNFKLYFSYHPDIKKGRVAILRTIGMKILDYKIPANATKPFNAVLIGGQKEDNFIKSLENESHTEITAKYIQNDTLKREAKQFLKTLNDELKAIIDEEINKTIPTDGIIDTSDLLYETQLNLKKELEKDTSKVKISKKKEIVKSNEKEQREKKRQAEKKKSTGNKEKRTPMKKQVANEERLVYNLQPGEAKRVSLPGKEYIELDLSNLDFHGNYANISFAVVDGMGNEYGNEINLEEMFYRVYHPKTNTAYTISKNKVYKVPVEESKIYLSLYKKTADSNFLKFMYQVEELADDL